ncbi:replication-relaxation family protein [Dactylosporangium sp. NPDC051541]|uniref:replication-relaxation family protein n=1 Tax=Dactylosporangium sp. NPDC051541 TaxID=3363977 RepID=UPI0037A05178
MPEPNTTRQLSSGEPSPPGRTTGGSPRDAARPAIAALIAVANRLRPRDYTIATLLDAHTALTTDQLTAILFTNRVTCRHRLRELHLLRFIDQFPHVRPGGVTTACWVPGVLSARYTALIRDESPPTARMLQLRQDRVMVSPILPHLLEVNDVFVGLLAHARRAGTGRLLRWWSERATAAAYGRRIHPDGHGVWADGGGSAGFFLELDRGTETIGRLVTKLAAYRRLRLDGGPGYPVVFVLPSPARERHLQQRLADTADLHEPLVVATTVPAVVAAAGQGVAGPVWWRAGQRASRVGLTRLPDGHGEPGPLNPGAPPPTDDPLYPLTLG